MDSIEAFHCGRCRAEVQATARHPAPYWSFGLDRPVLCCGQTLRPLEIGQVASVPPPRRRLVGCSRCGYTVWVVVQPVGSLSCAACRAECMIAPPDTRAAAVERALVTGQALQRTR